MSRRNRKKRKAAGFIVPLPFAIGMVLASTLSLGYLWLGNRCETIGKELKGLEARKEDLHRKCLYEESRWANMTAPQEIEKALRRHNLSVTWPSSDQIVRLSFSDVVEALANGSRKSASIGPQYVQVRRVPMND